MKSHSSREKKYMKTSFSKNLNQNLTEDFKKSSIKNFKINYYSLYNYIINPNSSLKKYSFTYI
ncbi:hypothetical protein BpHYR1_034336 [Brachionus plicatilis]|uniref:Uncharacterized protein n=1 Tax=Brachionus plicatilis TaxID=10195 RepID=A0A3M7RLZ4_BRAPC|nr:hypothetical protein BpHYR1_034336 [Brachionus plicatilis]